jgi:hypothetical protein
MFQRLTFGFAAAAAVFCFRTGRFDPLMPQGFTFCFFALTACPRFGAGGIYPLMLMAAPDKQYCTC